MKICIVPNLNVPIPDTILKISNFDPKLLILGIFAQNSKNSPFFMKICTMANSNVPIPNTILKVSNSDPKLLILGIFGQK